MASDLAPTTLVPPCGHYPEPGPFPPGDIVPGAHWDSGVSPTGRPGLRFPPMVPKLTAVIPSAEAIQGDHTPPNPRTWSQRGSLGLRLLRVAFPHQGAVDSHSSIPDTSAKIVNINDDIFSYLDRFPRFSSKGISNPVVFFSPGPQRPLLLDSHFLCSLRIIFRITHYSQKAIAHLFWAMCHIRGRLGRPAKSAESPPPTTS